VARRHLVRAADPVADGIVHAVVAEEVAAHGNPVAFARRIAAECVHRIQLQRRAGR